MLRRVVITGLGLVTPLGCGVEASWSRLLAGQSGARRIEEFDVSDLACQIGCFVPRGSLADGMFNPDDWMEPKEQRKVDDFIIYAMAAATQALEDAGWKADTQEKQERTGVMIGSGIGGLSGIAETALLLKEKGPRRVSPFFIPGRLINLAGGYVSIRHGLKGPNHAVVTACSTGAHAIGDASRLIALDDADVMVAGGTESPICRIGVAGFAACRALATAFNDRPDQGLAPLRQGPRRLRHRRGRRHRRARGAGACQGARRAHLCRGDRLRPVRRCLPHHRAGRRTATAPTAACAWRSKRAGIEPSDINTSMPTAPRRHGRRDRARRRRAPVRQRRRQARHVLDQVGHRASAGRCGSRGGGLLGAGHPRQYRPADAQPRQPLGGDRDRSRAAQGAEAPIDIALSNSFGFGGTNASLVLRRLAA